MKSISALLGTQIWAVTIQNEPAFYNNNGWEACSYSAEEEADFVKSFLGPQFVADYPDTNTRPKIMFQDFNKDGVADWADIM